MRVAVFGTILNHGESSVPSGKSLISQVVCLGGFSEAERIATGNHPFAGTVACGMIAATRFREHLGMAPCET